jgi:hypothetical protein
MSPFDIRVKNVEDWLGGGGAIRPQNPRRVFDVFPFILRLRLKTGSTIKFQRKLVAFIAFVNCLAFIS